MWARPLQQEHQEALGTHDEGSAVEARSCLHSRQGDMGVPEAAKGDEAPTHPAELGWALLFIGAAAGYLARGDVWRRWCGSAGFRQKYLWRITYYIIT